MDVNELEALGGYFPKPSGLGIQSRDDLDEVDILQMYGLPVGVHGILDPEVIGIRCCAVIDIIGQSIYRAEVVHIPPLVLRIDPVGALTGLVKVGTLKTSPPEDISIRLDLYWIVGVLLVEVEPVYLSGVTHIVCPEDI